MSGLLLSDATAIPVLGLIFIWGWVRGEGSVK